MQKIFIKNNFLKTLFLAFNFRILGAFSGLIMTYFISLVLPISDAGYIFYLITIVSFIGALTTLGLPMALLRFIGVHHRLHEWSKIKGLLNFCLKYSLLISFGVVALIVILLIFYNQAFEINNVFIKVSLIMLIAIPFFAQNEITSHAFQGIGRSLLSIFFLRISNQIFVALAICVLYFLYDFINLYIVAIIYTAGLFLTSCLSVFIWYQNKELRLDSIKPNKKKVFESAFPLWIILLMNNLVIWSGQIVAGFFLESSEVAILSISQRISITISIVLIAVNYVIAPNLASSFKEGNMKLFTSYVRLSSRFLLLIAFPITGIVLLYPKFLLNLFGNDYIAGFLVLQILAIGQFINVVTGSVGYILNMTGNEKVMRNIVLISGPLSIILSTILIPIYGIIGAAISISLALIFQNLLAVYFVKTKLGINTLTFWRSN